MAKVIWRGWVTEPEEIAKANMVTPLGPLVKRDGAKVICLHCPGSKSHTARNAKAA